MSKEGGLGKEAGMQILMRLLGQEQSRPEECRKCGARHFHRHGSYERGIVWGVGMGIEPLKVFRFLCVECWHTTSMLPRGVVTFRLLCLGILAKHLYDKSNEQQRDLLAAYRRHWEWWYPKLRVGIGNLMGRLPRGAREGWERLSSEEVNPELVDRTGLSLFGLYWIHAPQKVV